MSVGPSIKIEYTVPGESRRRNVTVLGGGGILGSNDARELGVVVHGNAFVRRLMVRPVVDVSIRKIEATLELQIGDADAIYLNGYNSWTDSWERPVYDRMWGLTRAPRQVVERYTLDGSGDYRFVPEDARRGHMHGFGYGYLRQGDKVLLFASLDEDSGLTLIREDLEAGTITLCKEPPARALTAGEERDVFSMCLVGGTLDEAIDAWLSLMGTHALPARPLVGYTSWYRHYDGIDHWKLASDLEGEKKVLLGMDLARLEPVFQIDDGYARVGDWLEYDRSRFPEGLRGLAQEAKASGLTPGLWLAPFVCEHSSRLYKEQPEWLLRDAKGNPVCMGSNWGGGFALDVRNEDVRTYVGEVLRAVTRDWGFELLKLDFLFAACMEPHDGMNRGELMADALELLRASVVKGTRLLLCGVPLVSAFGRGEYCRVGCDVGLDWDDIPHRRLLHRERVSTKNSLANARGRAHLDGKVFRCDPDVLFLREEGVSLTPGQRQEMIATDTSCGGVLLTSDNMGDWNAAQLDVYYDALRRFKAYNERMCIT